MGLVSELKKERSELQHRIAIIEELLFKYEGNSVDVSNNNEREPTKIEKGSLKELKSASTPQKLLMILKEHQRFMKIREIARYLELLIGGSEDDWTTKLSRTTGKLKEANKIKSFKVGKSNTNVFWGSPSWLDSSGNIKEGYKYETKAIDKSNTLLDL